MKETIKQILREGLISEEQQSAKPIRVKMDMLIPDDIKQIKDVFVKNKRKLYIVGGAVRDAILGKTQKDYDLATDAVPDKVEEMMAKAGFKTLPTGKAFGVINVFTDQGEYEVATFRSDRYKDDDLDGFKNYLKSLNNGSYERFLFNLTK
jgi:tRNA nucleotidyltransferase/poly(A) polymerase